MKKILIVTSCMWLMLATKTFAHPGNTDANNMHTCWTNCAKWGLEYGQYHGHGDTSTNISTNDVEVENYVEEDTMYIYEEEGNDLEEEGYTRGFQAAETNAEYNDYDYMLHRGNSPAAYERYVEGYARGYSDGTLHVAQQLEEQKKQDEAAGQMAGEERAVTDFLQGIHTPEVQQNKSEEWLATFQVAYDKMQQALEAIQQSALKDGYNGKETQPSYTGIKRDIYEKYYKKGIVQREEEAFQQGYNDAFLLNAYSPSIQGWPNTLQLKYKAGFDSNTEVTIIQQQAQQDASAIFSFTIPNDYSEDEYKQKSYEEAFQQQKKQLYKRIAFIGGSILLIFMTIFFVGKKRRVKKTFI